MLTDPVADMLTRIRNANKALHDTTSMPSSKLKVEIARLLKEEGYITDFRVESGESFDNLVIKLKYGRGRERVITDLKRVSKPGPPHLRAQGPPAARARRHGHRDPVHLPRADDQPQGRRGRASAARSSASSGDLHEPHRKTTHRVPAGVNVAVSPGPRPGQRPARRARAGRPAAHADRAGARATIVVTRPTERGEDRALHGLTRTLIANMVEGVTKGFEKRLEIQGVGYRAGLRGDVARAQRRLLAPGRDRAARRHHASRCRCRRRSSSRASTSRRSARRPPRSARCARRSRTRARASATRASSSAGRSGSAHEHSHDARGAPAPPSPRPQARPGHGRAAAPGRLPLEQGHLRPADRRPRGEDARGGELAGPAEVVQGHEDRAGGRGRQAARREREEGRRRDRRLRPRRLPVPRTRQGARRRRARGRTEVF